MAHIIDIPDPKTGVKSRTPTMQKLRITQLQHYKDTITEDLNKDIVVSDNNLKSIIPRPPGILKCIYQYEDRYTFTRILQPDTLVFTSHFESGNLHSAHRLIPTPDINIRHSFYDLYLHEDINNSNGNIQWFYFGVSNTRAYQTPDSLFKSGLRPLFYSRKSDNGWTRCGVDIKFFEDVQVQQSVNKQNKVKNRYYILRFTHTFLHDDDVTYFAYSHPYTYTDLQFYLKRIELQNVRSGILRRSVLCKTIAGNNCDVLTISSKVSTSIQALAKPIVIITARVHPGETAASWIMQGMIEFLLSNHVVAEALRNKFVFKIIPMLNPDGVVNGSTRTSLSGDDLNRQYVDPDEIKHPTIYHTKKLVESLVSVGDDSRRNVCLYMDLHGHSTKRGIFVFGCIPERMDYDMVSNVVGVAPTLTPARPASAVLSNQAISAPNANVSTSSVKQMGLLAFGEKFYGDKSKAGTGTGTGEIFQSAPSTARRENKLQKVAQNRNINMAYKMEDFDSRLASVAVGSTNGNSALATDNRIVISGSSGSAARQRTRSANMTARKPSAVLEDRPPSCAPAIPAISVSVNRNVSRSEDNEKDNFKAFITLADKNLNATDRAALEAKIRKLPEIFNRNVFGFSPTSCDYRIFASKISSARVVMSLELGITCTYTVEASMAGPSNDKLYTPQDLILTGEQMCHSIHDWMIENPDYFSSKINNIKYERKLKPKRNRNTKSNSFTPFVGRQIVKRVAMVLSPGRVQCGEEIDSNALPMPPIGKNRRSTNPKATDIADADKPPVLTPAQLSKQLINVRAERSEVTRIVASDLMRHFERGSPKKSNKHYDSPTKLNALGLAGSLSQTNFLKSPKFVLDSPPVKAPTQQSESFPVASNSSALPSPIISYNTKLQSCSDYQQRNFFTSQTSDKQETRSNTHLVSPKVNIQRVISQASTKSSSAESFGDSVCSTSQAMPLVTIETIEEDERRIGYLMNIISKNKLDGRSYSS